MLYKTLLKLKEKNGLTDDLKNKIDIFFATSRITEEQYNELMNIEENIEEQVKKYGNSSGTARSYFFTKKSEKGWIEDDARNYFTIRA